MPDGVRLPDIEQAEQQEGQQPVRRRRRHEAQYQQHGDDFIPDDAAVVADAEIPAGDAADVNAANECRDDEKQIERRARQQQEQGEGSQCAEGTGCFWRQAAAESQRDDLRTSRVKTQPTNDTEFSREMGIYPSPFKNWKKRCPVGRASARHSM